MTYWHLIRDFYWPPIRDVFHLAIYHRRGPCYRCRIESRLEALRQVMIPPL